MLMRLINGSDTVLLNILFVVCMLINSGDVLRRAEVCINTIDVAVLPVQTHIGLVVVLLVHE